MKTLTANVVRVVCVPELELLLTIIRPETNGIQER